MKWILIKNRTPRPKPNKVEPEPDIFKSSLVEFGQVEYLIYPLTTLVIKYYFGSAQLKIQLIKNKPSFKPLELGS